MWQWIGYGIGAALGLGFAGGYGQHWAVRALCAAGAVAGLVAGLAVALFAGKDSPIWDVALGGGLAFAVVSVGLGFSWMVTFARLRKWRALGVAVVIVALGAAVIGSWAGREVEAVALPVDDRGEGSAPVVVRQEGEAPGAGQVEGVAQAGCLCAEGALCIGPRGGRYCIKNDGGKKYHP